MGENKKKGKVFTFRFLDLQILGLLIFEIHLDY